MLHAIAVAGSFLCRKINIGEKKDLEKISNGVTALSAVYAIISLMELADQFLHSALYLLQKCRNGICIYVFIAAMLPPVTAHIEGKKRGFVSEKHYAVLNAVFNFFGAISACAMFRIAIMAIDDFTCLSVFALEDAIAVLIPLCVGFVLAYQSLEQKNADVGHGTSTKWLNQKLNMLHLFHVYFLAFLSVTFIVAYTVYCYMHGRNLEMDGWYFLLLTLMLLYFYLLSQHRHDYLRLIFAVMVPVILAASMYWMSWFSMSEGMRWWQWIFITVHSVVYALLFYISTLRNRKTGPKDTDEEEGGGDIKNRIFKLVRKHIVIVLLIMIIVGAYAVIWCLPLLGKRIGAAEAGRYVMEICEGTEADGEDVMERLAKMEMYDEAEDNFDMKEFLDFVSEELRPQLLEKGIVESETEMLQYDRLNNWYMGTR